MPLRLSRLIPASQLIVVHAILHEVDWPGIPEPVEATVTHSVFSVATAKTLLGIAEARGEFPSPAHRQCPSDLKRGSLTTFTRPSLAGPPAFGGRIVNCLGFRAEESPIQAMTEAAVFVAIAAVGQQPPWAYQAGMTRLSCCFCIMSSDQPSTGRAPGTRFIRPLRGS